VWFEDSVLDLKSVYGYVSRLDGMFACHSAVMFDLHMSEMQKIVLTNGRQLGVTEWICIHPV